MVETKNKESKEEFVNRAKHVVKVPSLLQIEAVECGAACLSMVLAYFKKFEPIEKVRVGCGVSRDGSKASNILKAARNYGLEAKGYKRTLENLKDLACPTIVFWNFNHFIVLRGIKNGKYYINDPASGPKILNEDDFDKGYTGVVMTFAVGKDFEESGKKPSIIDSVKKRMVGLQIPMAYVFLAGLFLVIPGLIIPVFTKVFVDEVLVKGMNDWLKPLLIAMVLTMIIKGALTWLQQYYLQRFQAKLALASSAKFLWHIFQLPMEFFSQRFAGEISGRVGINDMVAGLLSGRLANAMLDLVLVFFYAILMFFYSWELTLIGIVTALLNIWLLKYVSKKKIDMNNRLVQDRGKLDGISMGGLQAIETLKSTGTENDFFQKWSGYQAKVMNGEQELGQKSMILTSFPPFLGAINRLAILSLGSWFVMKGQMTMGELIAFQTLMEGFIGPVNNIVNLGSEVQDMDASLKRLDDVLKYPTDDYVVEGNKFDTTFDESEKKNGYLELKNISFGYSKLDQPLVDNFSISLKPGSRVALVGGSGSGKSTVAKLICGLVEPWSGEILFDGVKRKEVPRRVLNNSLAMVDQDIFLFEGTINDNISLWDQTVPSKSIVQALKDACIHDDVMKRPKGLASEVEEGGANFSGGQRQRLEIARALVGNPAYLVLDEATSALDTKTEKIVDGNIRRRGCTCIIVAHRLSTIRDCDEIIVLQRGKIVQRGTHDDLINIEGHYKALINV